MSNTNTNINKSSDNNISYYAWIIWLIAALFYAYEFFLRISPNVMREDLMSYFNIDAATVGDLSAYYYYAYAAMQIPVGIIMDRYSARWSLSFAALMVAIGCWLFATTSDIYYAELGRALMGVGSAFAFVGCLKLSAVWFPARYFAIVVGLTNSLGVIGAFNGDATLAFATSHMSWQDVMLYAAVIGFILGVLNLSFLRDQPPYCHSRNLHLHSVKEILRALTQVLKVPHTWLVALYGCLLVAPISGFGELWSASFLMSAYHIDKIEAGFFSSFIFIGIGVGGPLYGLISGIINKRKPLMWFACVGALLSMSLLLYLPIQSTLYLGTLLFTLGFFSSNMLLCFAINAENYPKRMDGIVIGFTNMVIMLGGTISQPLIGKLLDIQWTGLISHGAHSFSTEQYQLAMTVLPLCQAVALLCLWRIKETFCRACDDS